MYRHFSLDSWVQNDGMRYDEGLKDYNLTETIILQIINAAKSIKNLLQR